MTKTNNLLHNLTTDELEPSKDTLGGFQLLDSNVYATHVKMAYITQSSGGATGIALELSFEGIKQTHMETVWVTTKEGKNYYERDGQKNPLPGFTLINDLCLLTTEAPLSAQEAEEKKVEVYDWEAKGRVIKSMPVLVDLIGKAVFAGILKQTVNKRAANSAGVYVATAETKEENVLHKFFHCATSQTANEWQADGEAHFREHWEDRYTGVVLDKTVPVIEYSKPSKPSNTTTGKSSATAPKAKKNIFQD